LRLFFVNGLKNVVTLLATIAAAAPTHDGIEVDDIPMEDVGNATQVHLETIPENPDPHSNLHPDHEDSISDAEDDEDGEASVIHVIPHFLSFNVRILLVTW
jgi:hypothetical protein